MIFLRRFLVTTSFLILVVGVAFRSISIEKLQTGGDTQGTLVFTPHISPFVATVTLQPTIPSNIQVNATSIPIVTSPTATADPQFAIIETPDGLISVGYDFINNSDNPVWMIWIGDEVLFIDPIDVSTSALLDAFRDEVNKMMAAKSAFDSADRDVGTGIMTMIFEGLGVAGGTITGVISCGGVPFTFWLAGGTGWTCAGGIGAAIGAGGAFIITYSDTRQAAKDRKDEAKKIDGAMNEAEELFNALKNRMENQNSD